jgi:hypothetical protein
MNKLKTIKTRAVAILVGVAAVVGIGVTATATSSAAPTRSTTPVFGFADPQTPVGTSSLKRTSDGVDMTFRTDDLAARETVTIWWVVFNRPDECSGPCGDDDIFVGGDPAGELNEAQIDAADIAVAYATGKVASQSGRATFTAHLDVQEPPGTREVVVGDEVVLKDAASAEVHLVARSHGPVVREIVDEQIGSFAGGCEVSVFPPDAPSEIGECGDIQFAVHRP